MTSLMLKVVNLLGTRLYHLLKARCGPKSKQTLICFFCKTPVCLIHLLCSVHFYWIKDRSITNNIPDTMCFKNNF